MAGASRPLGDQRALLSMADMEAMLRTVKVSLQTMEDTRVSWFRAAATGAGLLLDFHGLALQGHITRTPADDMADVKRALDEARRTVETLLADSPPPGRDGSKQEATTHVR